MREELSTLTREQDRQNRVEGLEGRQCNVERVFCRSMPRGDTDLELSAIRIVLYTQQPFVAAGVRAVIQATSGYELTECCDTWAAAIRATRAAEPDIVLIHLTARISLGELGQLRA